MDIDISAISKSYKKNIVLRDINLTADNGQCIGILGSNGSGKSTFLSILAGIQRCDKGSFIYKGKDMFEYPKLRSELVGYVPQKTPLIEELTAWDNLLLWYERPVLKKELENGFLAMLGIPEFIKTSVSKMSGGMKKRLSIGCAISDSPRILLLDEPMASLDPACKQIIIEYIKNHKASGGIVIMATHDITGLSICDKWYIIKDGVLNPFQYDGNLETIVKSI